MVVVPMIKAVWKIIYFVSGLMGIVNFVQTFYLFYRIYFLLLIMLKLYYLTCISFYLKQILNL